MELKRQLGLGTATLIIIADVFGTGIFMTTGQVLEIQHPDFTYLNPNTGDLWHFPREGPIEVIDPAHIVKVRPKLRPPLSWLSHFFNGSKE